MSTIIQDKISIDTFQLALFFPTDTVFKSIVVAGKISEKLGDIFKEEPNIITLPPNAPPEIPKIIYNQEGVGHLNIGYTRADLIIKTKNRTDLKEKIKLFAEVLNDIFTNTLRIKIIRVALVEIFNLNRDYNLELFMSNLVSDERIRKSDECNLSWLTKERLEDIEFNLWTRFIVAEQPESIKKIIFDLNTSQEKMLDVSKLSIADIFESFNERIGSEVDNVLRL